MKRILRGFVLCLASVLLFCTITSAVTWGSGNLATQKREVPQFQSIELAGDGNVYIQQGSIQSLEVTTDGNLLNKLETESSNGKLKIGFKPGVRNVTRLEVRITMKDLDAVIISGSGNVQGKGLFKTHDFQAKISGSGNISLELNANRCNNEISGSGNIRLKGNADEEVVFINGSGNYFGFGLPVKKAQVVIRGSGNSEINVADQLSAEIYGSGNVDYKGRPIINCTFGSGRLESRD